MVTMLAIAVGGFAQENKIPPAKKDQVYGKVMRADAMTKAQPVKDLPTILNGRKEAENIVLTGTASTVCQSEGCWFTLMMPGKDQVLVKTKDHAFFLPKDIIGKKLLVEGTAMEKLTPVSELRHYAMDAGKTEAEIKAISQPKREYSVVASSVRVLD